MTDVAQTDALGGQGSLDPSIAVLAVQGFSRAVDGYLSAKYPLTSFNEPYAYEGGGQFEAGNPDGYLVPRSAPQRGVVSTTPVSSAAQNPVVWIALAAVLLVAAFALHK